MIKKEIYGDDLKSQLRAAANDRLYKFMMADGMIRGGIVNCTRMVNEMRANHGLGVVETLVLGQAYVAASLMIATMKGKDRISINIQCSGPVKGLDVESNVFGEVRGFLKNRTFSEESSGEETSLSHYFGAGFLTVTRYLEEIKRPYSGKIMLEYGTLAEDMSNYFLQSEQIPTAFNLSVYFDDKGLVAGAGGLFLQAMPGADTGVVSKVENALKSIASPGNYFSKNRVPDLLVAETFDSFRPVFLENQRVEFFCRCSEARMRLHLGSLPRDEVNDIIENGPFPVEIRCHNCNTVYRFARADLVHLRQ